MDILRIRAYLCSTVLFFTVLLAGCSDDVHDHPTLVTGKQLFEHHCSGCHKNTGKGKFLKGVPANKDTNLSASQVLHKITSNENGGNKMPSFNNMSTEEAAKISVYVKTL
jgi:mono/diheme cytochrome c family protein